MAIDRLDVLRDAANQLLGNLDEYVITEIIEGLAAAGKLNSKSLYLTYRALELGTHLDEIEEEIERQLDKSREEAQKLFVDAAKELYNGDMKRLDYKAPPFEMNYQLQQIIQGQMDVTSDELDNLTQTIGCINPQGQPMELHRYYTNTLDWVFNCVSAGVMTYDEAMRLATEKLVKKGLVRIDYKSGRSISVEAGVRRCILGGLGLLTDKIVRYDHDLMGATGWEISAHAHCAPDHEHIQGKQFTNEEYDELNRTLKRPVGMLNCGHYAFPIMYGETPPIHSQDELRSMVDDNAAGQTIDGKHYTEYEIDQAMRRREVAVREANKKLKYAKKTDSKDYIAECRSKYNIALQQYQAFADKAGRRVQLNRLYTAKTVPDTATMQDTGKNGILPVTENSIAAVKPLNTNLYGTAGAKVLQEAQRMVLRQVKDKPPGTEAAAILGKDLSFQSGHIGEAGRVKVPQQVEPYVVIHNHPTGSTFSHTDIWRFAKDDNLLLSVVVGNNGSTYAMEKGPTFSHVGYYMHYNRVAALYPGCANVDAAHPVTAERYMEYIEALLKGLTKYGGKYHT